MKKLPGPISVVYAIATLKGGGSEKQLHLLLSRLDRSQFRPAVVTYGGGYWEAKIRELDIPVRRINYHKGRVSSRVSAIFETCKYLRANPPVILHSWGFSPYLVARLAASLARVPIILASERSALSARPWPYWSLFLERLLQRQIAFYLTNSRHAADSLVSRRIMPASKVRAIPNGIDVAQYTPSFGSADGLRIGYLANFRRVKNHFFLLDAAKQVVAAVPQATFHFFGDGPLRSAIEAKIEALGLQGKVRLYGWVEDPREILPRLDMYVHVAELEGFPNAIMEAMACALPCIGANHTGCAELIDHEQTGLLFTPHHLMELVSAIQRLAQDRQLARRLGENGRRKLQEQFSVEKMVAATARIYWETLGHHTPQLATLRGAI